LTHGLILADASTYEHIVPYSYEFVQMKDINKSESLTSNKVGAAHELERNALVFDIPKSKSQASISKTRLQQRKK
jgi:hypothetical protein